MGSIYHFLYEIGTRSIIEQPDARSWWKETPNTRVEGNMISKLYFLALLLFSAFLTSCCAAENSAKQFVKVTCLFLAFLLCVPLYVTFRCIPELSETMSEGRN